METFVVRAWRSERDGTTAAGDGTTAAGDDGALRGVVEHVGSGATVPFQDVEQLISFLRAAPDDGG